MANSLTSSPVATKGAKRLRKMFYLAASLKHKWNVYVQLQEDPLFHWNSVGLPSPDSLLSSCIQFDSSWGTYSFSKACKPVCSIHQNTNKVCVFQVLHAFSLNTISVLLSSLKPKGEQTKSSYPDLSWNLFSNSWMISKPSLKLRHIVISTMLLYLLRYL